MILTDLGDTWSNQPEAGYTPEEGNWFGGEGVAVGDFNQDARLDIFIPTLAELACISLKMAVFSKFLSAFPTGFHTPSVGASAVIMMETTISICL